MENNYYKYSGAAGEHLHSIGQQTYGAVIAPKKAIRYTRLNCAAIVLCLLVPWVLFCMMSAVMSFAIRYHHAVLAYVLGFLGFIIVCIAMKLAFDAAGKQHTEGANDTNWYIFFAAACAVAWGAGVILGDLNYFYNMEPFYDVRNLNYYPQVDPSTMSGQQVMDAGRLTFVLGSKLDQSKTIAFRSADVYCAAPVVNTRGNASSSYDFWAVGLNCCTGKPAAFKCGEYNNPSASSGLRVMRDDQRDFYRLAVQQAAATYNIKATHPLFFYWMQDPIAEVNAYRDEGLKYFLFGMFCFLAFMLASVIAAMVLFSTSRTLKENRHHTASPGSHAQSAPPVQAFLPGQKAMQTSQTSTAAIPFSSRQTPNFGLNASM